MTDDSFLGRWSRRKAEARAGHAPDEPPSAEPPPAPAGPPAETPAGAEDEEALSDAELLARHDLPDPETLTAKDDVAAFMRAGVPARLRRLALRRLWRLDPVFGHLDGLVDYDQDFTDKATVLSAMSTVYRVGRGVVGESETPPPAEADDHDRATGEPDRPADPADPSASIDTGETPPREAAAAAPESPPRRRRMVFVTRGRDEDQG